MQVCLLNEQQKKKRVKRNLNKDLRIQKDQMTKELVGTWEQQDNNITIIVEAPTEKKKSGKIKKV